MFNATISLLMFCLEDLSIVDSRVLKSPLMTILLPISFLKFSKIFFIYLGASILGPYMFMRILCLLLDYSLKYYVVTFFVPCYDLCFEVCLVWYWYCSPAFFFSNPFAWNTLFYLFIFRLYISFVLRCISVDCIYVGHVF